MAYNRLFETLVDSDDDEVHRLIAYGLYKIAKREWVQAFPGQHGRAPNDQESALYTAVWTPAMVDGKRGEATEVLDRYAFRIVERERPTIVEQALRGRISTTILLNVASAFLYTLLLIAVVAVLRRAGVDLLSIASTK